MKKMLKQMLLAGLGVVMAANFSFAQTRSNLVGVTYRIKDLQICNGDLGDFYKRYINQQLAADIFFENLQIIKSKKNFYLLAKEQNSNRAYAFSLIKKGNGLYLDTEDQVKVTNQGEAMLTSILRNGNEDLSSVETVVASSKP